jgi:hypothetical protein
VSNLLITFEADRTYGNKESCITHIKLEEKWTQKFPLCPALEVTMSNTVFILGAGASRMAGGPLMSDFLDIASDVNRSLPGPNTLRNSFLSLEQARKALQSMYAQVNIDLDNIEDLFATFEMMQLLGIKIDTMESDPSQLLKSIREIIVQTLQQRIRFSVRHSPELNRTQLVSPKPYDAFLTLIKTMMKNDVNPIIITFNYDIAVDYALSSELGEINYCLGPPQIDAHPKLLKLHGSLNWAQCSCGSIIPYPLRDYASRALSLYDPGDRLILAPPLDQLKHCNQPMNADPIIVPPTWNKTMHHNQIAPVWKAAANHLKGAENIFVIGYSLPPSDQFFRLLFGLSTSMNLKRLSVFDPDKEVKTRFEKLLGPRIANRFEFYNIAFDMAIKALLRIPSWSLNKLLE